MNHEFQAHPTNTAKCIDCGYPEDKHGDNAECECCTKTGNLQIFGSSKTGDMMLLTRECMEREKAIIEQEINNKNSERSKAIEEYQSEANQERRLGERRALTVPYHDLIKNSRILDDRLHLSSDIFTAKTVSIEDIRKHIFNNDNIPADKKFFEYVAECKRRISHFQKVIFELDKQKIEAYSEQKAWHISMNDYANKLRSEEREQLKIQDIHYDVKLPKVITPRTVKLQKHKASKTEIRDAASKLSTDVGKTVPEYMIAMLMTSKNWDLDTACNHLRRSLKEGLSA